MSDNKDIINGSSDDNKQRCLDHTTTYNNDGSDDKKDTCHRSKDREDSNADQLEKKISHHDSKERNRYQGDNNDYNKTEESRDHRLKNRKDRHHSRHNKSDSKHRDMKKSSKKRRRNDTSSESSSNSDEYNSDSDSDDNRRRRHDKEKKKKHESKKHKRDDDRLKDKKKKKKKHKKERKNGDRAASEYSTSATPTFGQYGIIKSSDMLKMQRSFEIWLSEVHGVHISSSNIPRYELQQYFDTYREDYNTATLPHIKYYNYDKWELEEHEKQKRELEQTGQNSSAIINDERNHAMEMQRIAKQKEEAALQLIAATMNTTKVKEMQHQKHLQTQMQMAFKIGDRETYRKIKDKLQPEEK